MRINFFLIRSFCLAIENGGIFIKIQTSLQSEAERRLYYKYKVCIEIKQKHFLARFVILINYITHMTSEHQVSLS